MSQFGIGLANFEGLKTRASGLYSNYAQYAQQLACLDQNHRLGGVLTQAKPEFPFAQSVEDNRNKKLLLLLCNH